MSNRLSQGIVHQMRDTIDRADGVVDDQATVMHAGTVQNRHY